MKNKLQRKSEAQVRLEEYKALTTAQKLIKLDLRLGGNMGAAKQRQRLANQLEKEKHQAPKESKLNLDPSSKHKGRNGDRKVYIKPKRS